MVRRAISRGANLHPIQAKTLFVLVFASLMLATIATEAGAFQRDQIDAGFQLDQLVALGGAGADPGAGNLQARLDWAVATAIPLPWRQLVPVVWSVGEVTSGHLALSFYDGTAVVSPRLLRRSSEEVLATIAHEMGHQIVISLVPAQDGTPPRGFVEFLPGNPYRRFDEGWADCVARVWTGSLLHTTSEPAPCSVEAARYVAALLTDPQNLQRESLPLPSPLPSPSPEPSPVPATVPTQQPEPQKSPIVRPPPESESGIDPAALIVGGIVLLVIGPFALAALVKALVPPDGGEHR
jgi:hypothetical protein